MTKIIIGNIEMSREQAEKLALECVLMKREESENG